MDFYSVWYAFYALYAFKFLISWKINIKNNSMHTIALHCLQCLQWWALLISCYYYIQYILSIELTKHYFSSKFTIRSNDSIPLFAFASVWRQFCSTFHRMHTNTNRFHNFVSFFINTNLLHAMNFVSPKYSEYSNRTLLFMVPVSKQT